MSIFKTYIDYINYIEEDYDELIEDEYVDIDCINIYDLSEYTLEVGEDELPF